MLIGILLPFLRLAIMVRVMYEIWKYNMVTTFMVIVSPTGVESSSEWL